MRTTLASSDLEAVCAAVRACDAYPRDTLATLEARLRMTTDTRPLAQRNADAVRQVLATVPPNRPVAELVGIASRRIAIRLDALGLDRQPSQRTIKRILLDKPPGMSTQPVATAIRSEASTEET